MKFKDILLMEEDLENTWKEFAILLKKHDWMYSMSGDDRAYKKGDEEDQRIRELRKKLREVDRERVIKTYKENVPKYILDVFVTGWEKNI